MNPPEFSRKPRAASFERKVITGSLIAIVATYFVGIAAAILYEASIEPEYKATARFQIYRTRTSLAGAGDKESLERDALMDDRDFNTKLSEMRSSAVIMGVGRRFSLEERCEALAPYQKGDLFSGPLSAEEVIGKCRSIRPDRPSFSAVVEYTHPNKDLARKIAGYFVEEIQRANAEEISLLTDPLVERMKIQIDQLYSEILELKTQMAAAAEPAASELERELRNKDVRFTRLTADFELEKTRLASAIGPSLRLIDAPTVSDRPVNKNTALALAIATGTATAISAFIALVAGIGLFLRRAANPPGQTGRP